MSARHAVAQISLWVFLLVGCASLPPVSQLPAEEQGLYRVYRRIMPPGQLRAYLALPTAADRQAYAKQVGASQILEALSEQDRAAVLQGYPFEGMSKTALLLLWGEPYLRQGSEQDERWYYFGDSVSLPDEGSTQSRADTVMEVSIEDGHLKWWEERVPSEENLRFFRRLFLNTPAD